MCSRQCSPNSASISQTPRVVPGERASVSIRLPSVMIRDLIVGNDEVERDDCFEGVSVRALLWDA